MVRSKNVLSLLMQVFVIFCLLCVLWAIYGYSMAFTQGRHSRSSGASVESSCKGMNRDCQRSHVQQGRVHPRDTCTSCFQLTFAAITPCLIVGAFAERVKFARVLVFMVLWFTFSYCPIAHMVWFWAGPDAYTNADSR